MTVSLLPGARQRSLADSHGPPAVADARSLPAGSANRVETYVLCWLTSHDSEHVPHSLLDTGGVDILRIPEGD